MQPAIETTIPVPPTLDVTLSWGSLRRGRGDPTIRIDGSELWRPCRTPAGPATLCLDAHPGRIAVRAWGPGAACAVGRAADIAGCADTLDGWEPAGHPLVAELDRRFRGVRFPATRGVLDAIVPSVLEQKVTSVEAYAAWRRLVWAWGEPAPGPVPLRLPPPPDRLAAAPYHAYHRFGIERRRADTIRGLAARPGRVEEAARLGTPQGRERLEAFPGVGPWTSAEVAAVAWADADAVSVGDYHLASTVVYAFTGTRGGDDDAMLELLEPFRPHRGRVARLVKLAGMGPPRRAPRARLRDFRRF